MRASLRSLPAVAALAVPLVLTAASAAEAATPAAPEAVATSADDPEEHSGMSDAEMAGHDDAGLGLEPEPGEHGDADHEGTGRPEDPDADHGSTEDGHDDAAAAPARPRVAVLSAFAAINTGVLVVAAWIRRRDRSTPRHRPRPPRTPAPATQPV